MSRILTGLSGIRSLIFVPALVLISFLTIGGCNNNNGNGGDIDAPAPAPQTSCFTSQTVPCSSITPGPNNTVVCILSDLVCAFDLNAVLDQANANSAGGITGDTVMWIEAWGGSGGDSTGIGGKGGYAITTTSVNDIVAKNNNSTFLFYFLGSNGVNAADSCGAGGGVSTILTTEDLALNPSAEPTQTVPPILLVAGGGGGSGGSTNDFVCSPDVGSEGADGGTAIAVGLLNANGAGGSTIAGNAQGGNPNGQGKGGARGCIDKTCNANNATGGMDDFGGLGGVGGRGSGCVGTGANNFKNTPVQLGFSNGLGGNGGGNQATCVAGGGGGGGGYGGGGGGGQGNGDGDSTSGAGGGSFAIGMTKASPNAPTTVQPSPCVDNIGTPLSCIRITFQP